MNCCSKDALVRKLSAVSKMKRGTSITKKDIVEGNIPVISGGQAPAYYCNKSNRTEDVITIAGSGAYAGFVQYWNKPIFVCDAFSVQGIDGVTNTKYLYYVLQGMQNKIFATKKGSGVPHVHISCIENFEIPIPPLAVQEEIVRILDKFTELEAELEAELEKEQEARKKQYEWYRDRLLSFDSNHPFTQEARSLALEDVLTIKNGRDWKNLPCGNIPVYGSGGIMGFVNKSIYSGPTVLIPRKGSLDKLYFVDKPFWNVDTVFYTEINDNIVFPKYVFYCLQKAHLEQLNKAGGVPSLTQSTLNKVRIPVPPIADQQRIVAILDRLDVLCNDITTGLPAEIAARRKQYEYYRDRLLSFEEVA